MNTWDSLDAESNQQGSEGKSWTEEVVSLPKSSLTWSVPVWTMGEDWRASSREMVTGRKETKRKAKKKMEGCD